MLGAHHHHHHRYRHHHHQRFTVFQKIVGYPPTTQLSSEEQDLVWKFRFYLATQKEVSGHRRLLLKEAVVKLIASPLYDLRG